jgi:hypothetical protein
MTDIEAKALALVNEVLAERELPLKLQMCRLSQAQDEALCRAIEAHEADKVAHASQIYAMHSRIAQTEEQHEAFKQEVSDAVAKAIDHIKDGRSASAAGAIGAFVIRKPKPDPLVDVVARLGWGSDYVPVVRATLDFFDLEIREKGQ